MARPKKETETVVLPSLQQKFTKVTFWLVGDTPLIVNAWSEKARREMLGKQQKVVKPSGKAARDVEAEFESSLYEMEPGEYGFPVTGVKKCILSAAHKDKGIPRTMVMSALFLHADMVRVRPALSSAVCDMPLVRIYGTDPEMREDMVKIGQGLKRVANLAYRGQFTRWAMRIVAKLDQTELPLEQLQFLVTRSGMSCGIGEWRNERGGIFGGFHWASPEEVEGWEAYRRGGKLPEAPADEAVDEEDVEPVRKRAKK